jgi:hypothetical protein
MVLPLLWRDLRRDGGMQLALSSACTVYSRAAPFIYILHALWLSGAPSDASRVLSHDRLYWRRDAVGGELNGQEKLSLTVLLSCSPTARFSL